MDMTDEQAISQASRDVIAKQAVQIELLERANRALLTTAQELEDEVIRLRQQIEADEQKGE